MSSAENRILEAADEAYKSKVSIEQKAVRERYKSDKETIKKILKIVKSRLVYKELGDRYYNRKYVVVTEEILLKDYTTPPERSWNHGTKIETHSNGKDITLTVNGHVYRHLGGLFTNYKEQIEKAIKDNDLEREKLSAKRDNIKNMEQLEPHVKKMLLEFQEVLNDNVKEVI